MRNKPVEQAGRTSQCKTAGQAQQPRYRSMYNKGGIAGKELLLVGRKLNCCMPDDITRMSQCEKLGSTLYKRTQVQFRSSSSAKICCLTFNTF